MKQFFLGAFLVLLTVGNMEGQDYKKQLKSINKNLAQYFLDPVTFKASLGTALTDLDNVMKADDAKADPLSWISKGQIYNEIAKAEMIRKIADPKYDLATPGAGITAFDAFQMAINTPSKKSSLKDALVGIRENEDYTNNIGITYFQNQKYDNAFENFNVSLKASELLSSNKAVSRLAVDTIMRDQLFYTGVCAYYGEKYKAEAVPLFEKLYNAGKAQPLVYEALFNLLSDKDINKASTILEAGRKAHPEDSGLLFAEINYYLKVNKLDILVGKLKDAIAKEPNNVTVYTTLGNVYDQLNQKERPTNETKADEYFNLALDYYSQARKIDPTDFDAVYSQGQLYYNKAAGMTEKLNALSNDFSSLGSKKYNALKAEMDGYFLKGMPYFLEAEIMNPKDTNTLIALKEIYARDNKLDKSAEYKAKLEANKK